MFDSRQSNLRLSSSLAFLLLISSVAGGGVAPGFKIQGLCVHYRDFSVQNRRRANLEPLTATLSTPREPGFVHC